MNTRANASSLSLKARSGKDWSDGKKLNWTEGSQSLDECIADLLELIRMKQVFIEQVPQFSTIFFTSDNEYCQHSKPVCTLKISGNSCVGLKRESNFEKNGLF
jgi:hypothetical protein